MPTPNSDLMRSARESLSGKWGLAVATFFIYTLILGMLGWIPFAGFVVTALIAGPLGLGAYMFALSIAKNEEAKFDQLFDGFNHFATALGAYLIMTILIILYTLLLIIPGIIKSISYAMTFFILAENKEMDGYQAILKSKEMMYGYKSKFFGMLVVFFLWSLACVLTLGIGFLFLIPYMYVSYAKFYEDIKNNPIPREA